MTLAVRARPEARQMLPAVVHRDGTVRLQVVLAEVDPFTFAFLEGMGRYVGAEVAINTSLNVQSPIVQTPQQAIDALRRAKAMTALLFIAAEGDAVLTWETSAAPPKDGGRELRAILCRWPLRSQAPDLVRF